MKKWKQIIGIIFIILFLGILLIFLYQRQQNKVITNQISSDAAIYWDENGITIEGSDTPTEGSSVTITSGGTYTLSGSSADGNIIVNAKGQEVTLIFSSLNLTSKTTAPVYIKQATTVTILLEEGSENTLSDTSSYQNTDNDEINSVLHSKADLIIRGTGTLNIVANYNNGINGKDTVTITDSKIHITATNNGIKAKDSLTIENATINIEAEGNGIKTYNETDPNSGTMEINNSEITIVSSQDSIEAITSLTLNGGTYHLTSGNGSSNASNKNSQNNWGMWGNQKEDSIETTSAKGLKADGNITISSGTFIINSSDDSIHSNDTIVIENGDLNLSSGDDGIHADNTLTIEDGNINIDQSYEGLESSTIYLNGGTVHITSSDDGINAGGGNDSSSMNRPGANTFANDGSVIYISDGYYVVDANGDGIDSNGDIHMTGGTLIIMGPTSDGDGAIDYNGTFNMNGGTLIAAGSSGMAEAPSNSSTQNVIKLSFTKQNANAAIQIADQNGNVLLTFSPSKTYSSLVYSSSLLKQNQNYTISLGGSVDGDNQDGIYSNPNDQNGSILTTLTLTSQITTYGNNGMTAGQGGMNRPPR